jgi:hypothetical protein
MTINSQLSRCGLIQYTIETHKNLSRVFEAENHSYRFIYFYSLLLFLEKICSPQFFFDLVFVKVDFFALTIVH